jgi:Fe-S-cluster containining protein
MPTKTKPVNVQECKHCGAKCCKYVAIEIDAPDNTKDFHDIRWYLCHKDVWVFIDHDDAWYVQFNAQCEFLQKDSTCGIYDTRPKICENHDPSDCEDLDESDAQQFMLKSIEDLDMYLKLKGRKIRWKR